MSSDAFRRVAEALRNSSVALRTSDSTASTIQRHIAKALFDLAGESDKETPHQPQPASPNVRQACSALAALAERYYRGECPHGNTAQRLATEARAALAEPVAETPSVQAMLLNECVRLERWLACEVPDPDNRNDQKAVMLGALRVVITIAKGQSHG